MAACADFNILEHIECSLCFDIFENTKCLECNHSFCKECIDEILQFNDDGSATVDCPQCKKQTFIDATKTANDLLPNFQTKRLVDAYMTHNKR